MRIPLLSLKAPTGGFCPSCTARRMSSTAAHLVDQVLPALPYRQWVLSAHTGHRDHADRCIVITSIAPW
jgi:hypothetical protein